MTAFEKLAKFEMTKCVWT